MQQIHLVLGSQEQHQPAGPCWSIRRRDFYSGMISVEVSEPPFNLENAHSKWQQNKPILLPALLKDSVTEYAKFIKQSQSLYQAVLDGKDIDEILASHPYEQNLAPMFELLCSRFDSSDDQEIVTLDFDTHIEGELIEDIWMRVSWLSFEENDASLRFRFSFGMEGYEDVSQDLQKQTLAATLEEKVFPESAIITQSKLLKEKLTQIIGSENFEYLERIVYFNAPNGGAQFHHDAEKGHVGVVYAQLSGKTFWLALSKQELIEEIVTFVAQADHHDALLKTLQENEALNPELMGELSRPDFVDQALNNLFHPELMLLLNNNQAFFQRLVAKGYGYFLQPGDVILLPQESMENCAWHSVFCVGEEAGEALSFALKKFD